VRIDKESNIRWGIIGCGQIAYDKVMPALAAADNADLVALSDPDAAQLDRARVAFPQAKCYAEMNGVLADDSVDAVYIATPNFLHAEQAIAAASAGKHVLVEKPMAINAAEARQMVEAAEQANVKLMVAYMTLFNPAYKAAKRVVDAGMLGDVVSVRGRHSYVISPESISSAAAWRLDRDHGGGPLMDVAVYPTFTLRDLTRLRITELCATGAVRQLHGETEFDSVLLTFLLEDGTPGVIEATFTYAASHIELEGTRGRLALIGHVTQAIAGRLEVELWMPGQHAVGEQITHEIVPGGLPHFYNYLGEVEHFGDCILNEETPVSSGREALHEMLVADATRESIRSDRRIELRH
jgi:predicted dehydrogenase